MTTATKDMLRVLCKLNACNEAREWAATQPDPTTAWQQCPRGDWMLWLIGQQVGAPGTESRKRLVLAACRCARLALDIYERRYPDDPRPRRAIETAEAHVRGEATLQEMRTAAAAAYAASAYSSSAYASSSAAADAADAASADAAYAEKARDEIRMRCAAIVRELYPEPPVFGD